MEKSNKFCLKELYIKQNFCSSPYLYSPQLRTSRYHFGIIEEGSLTMTHLNETIHAEAGDVIFLPKGTQHISQWKGSPCIREWDIMFTFASDLSPKYTMQKISGASDEIRSLAQSIYNNFNSDVYNISFAFSDFYRLFGLLFPHLTASNTIFISETLYGAIAFMKHNLAHDIKIEDIAKHCNVCESTIYHSFRDELNTSPINYLNSLRISQAIDYMKHNKKQKLSAISELCGFNSETHFRKTFFKFAHTSPSEYRKMI